VIRRIVKKGVKVAKAARTAANGFVKGPQGPGFGVAEYEDFHKIRLEAAEQDRREGVAAEPGDDLGDIADGTLEISAEDLRILLEIEEAEDRPTLLDVREDHEWRTGHLPDAVHVPLGTLEGRLGELPADRAVVVYCATGMRSIDASYILKRHDRKDVRSVAGGIEAWKRAGSPIDVPA
jgi:rhodanese-related sulfurtransferase